MNHTKTALIFGCTMLALSACDNLTPKKEHKLGSLTRQLQLVDQEGTIYGTAELDPVSGGKLYDTQGRVIGTIVTPAVTSTVTTVSPTTPSY